MGNFQWTDELVSEFAEIYKINISKVGHLPHFVRDGWMKNFKESHKLKERISIGKIIMTPTSPGSGYTFFLKKGDIPPEKIPEIEQAIEKVLNSDMPPINWVFRYTQEEVDKLCKDAYNGGGKVCAKFDGSSKAF